MTVIFEKNYCKKKIRSFSLENSLRPMFSTLLKCLQFSGVANGLIRLLDMLVKEYEQI